MRTTIRLDDTLLRTAKARAASSGRSLNDFITDAIRAAVAARPGRSAAATLPTFGGEGLQRGVDLDDSAALLDVMEDRAFVYPHPAPHPAPARRVAERPARKKRT
jgi:plasmid stability protein